MVESAQSQEFDILIVGGGMAGAALACALGQAATGWRIGLIDPQTGAPAVVPGPRQFQDVDLRVSALTQASEQFLQAVGAWELMRQQGISPYRGMCVWDADGTGEIAFDAADLHESVLGHIVENRVTLGALWARLAELPVEVLSGRVSRVRRQEDYSQLILDDDRILSARLVVAADGADSPMRRLAQIPTREWDYEQQAIVATVTTEQSNQRVAWQRFLPTGPLAFLPLDLAGNAPSSSIVWSTSPEQAQALMALDDQAFCQALSTALEQRLGRVTRVSRRASFPLRQRHAKDYVRPGLALVADAAHTIHPLAGQGINLGFLDVAVLADELLRAQERGTDFADHNVLRRYQRRRIGHNLAMMAAMEGFKRLFGADPLPLRWIRNTGMRWLNGQGLLKNQVAALAMGRDLLPERWQPSLARGDGL